jgi:hypothetical protein
MSSRLKSILIALIYALLLGVSVWGYHYYPEYRVQLTFWIPQIFLLILITVTTLYVFYTADLVEETKRLQQRPLLQVSFCEVSELCGSKFDDTLEYGQRLLKGAVQVIGGEEMQIQSKYLAVELKNIGQTTARNIAIKLNMAGPDGKAVAEEKLFAVDIERDKNLQVAIAPSSVPWMLVEIQSVIYSDGLRNHAEFSGNSRYSTSSAQLGSSSEPKS